MSHTRLRVIAVISASAVALSGILTLVLSTPATGVPSVASVARAARTIQAPVSEQAPDVYKKAAALALQAKWSAQQELLAREHKFHINHLNQLAKHRGSAQYAAPSASSGYRVTSSFQACVIRAEDSSGDPQIMNSTGHYGLYQFSYSTWVASGGDPALFGHASAAYQTQIFWNAVRLRGTSDWAPYDGCGGPVTTTSATTSSAPSGSGVAGAALAWALTQTGVPYEWGGTGPGGYDCSGLVMMAYEHAGVQLPRTTYEMLASSLLVPTSNPAPGDLAFYGSGHVELYAGGDRTFGAHNSGTVVGYITEWMAPTYYRVT